MNEILLIIESLGQISLLLNNIIKVVIKLADKFDDSDKYIIHEKLEEIRKNIFKLNI